MATKIEATHVAAQGEDNVVTFIFRPDSTDNEIWSAARQEMTATFGHRNVTTWRKVRAT